MRFVLAAAAGLLCLLLSAAPARGQATFLLDRVIQTTPFANAAVSVEDGEGMAYVPVNDTLWLGEDNGDALYEVDRASGHLLSVITRLQLAGAVQLGGTATAGENRARDIEALAYDPSNDILYVFSTDCCPNPPTAFRLVRNDPGGGFHEETFQPLPSGFSFTGAAFHPSEGLYVTGDDEIRPYDYLTNTLGAPVPLDPEVEGTIFGLGFSADGSEAWLVTSADRVYRLNWASKTIVPGHVLELLPFGLSDGRAVDIVNGQLYVFNGAEDLAVTVFSIGGGPAAPSSLIATAGDNRIDLLWTDNANNESGFEIHRCPGTADGACSVVTAFTQLATVGADVTAYADLDVPDGQPFTYLVRAFTSEGPSGFSNPATATAGPPAAPSDLVATAVSGHRIDLTWTDNGAGESAFRIDRCLGTAASCGLQDFVEIAQVGPGTTAYTDAGLTAQTTYTYVVRALNNAGLSDPAGPAEATTPAGTNLLANASFEEDADADGTPDGWNPIPAFSRSNEVVRTGFFAARHSAPNDAQYTVRQWVPVTPSTAYTFSGCVNVPVSPDVFDFRFQVRWLDGAGTILSQKTLASYTTHTGGAWDCAMSTGLVPPADAAQAEVRMVAKSIALTFYTDDLVFEAE